MRTLTTFIIACISLMQVCHGQYWQPKRFCADPNDFAVVDTASYRFMYRLTSVKDPRDIQNSTFEDIQALDIGAKVSKYYSWLFYQYAFYAIENTVKAGAALSTPLNENRGSYGYEIFKNYPKSGQITVTDLGEQFFKTQYVYDDKVVFDWKIGSETVNILGYKCQKATTSFRGRDYTAWFTMDIPISNGPWKFGGLPGLIMKIEDSERHYVFECIGMENISEPVKYYNVKFTKIGRQDMEKLYIRMHKDEIAFQTSLGLHFLSLGPGGGEITNSKEELPYNPIERE